MSYDDDIFCTTEECATRQRQLDADGFIHARLGRRARTGRPRKRAEPLKPAVGRLRVCLNTAEVLNGIARQAGVRVADLLTHLLLESRRSGGIARLASDADLERARADMTSISVDAVKHALAAAYAVPQQQ